MASLLQPESMKPDVRRWTGISAIAVACLMTAEFLTASLGVGAAPPLDDEAALGQFMTGAAYPTLLVIFIDTFLMAALVVFLASFRHLIVRARTDMRWVADLGYGAGLIFVAVTLVGDAMDGGGALDTVKQQADGTVIRALTEGHILMFGSIGCVMTALVVAAAGYVTFASATLPRWTGWLAFVVAALNLVTVPAMFNGTSSTDLFSAGGPGVTALATFPFLVWVAIVGIVTIRGTHHHAMRRAQAAQKAAAEASAAPDAPEQAPVSLA
ncbi:hypothetical protein [Subtercola endophyticus]|uniref:hypothetical protein n=1 Tax=Subtercola endophyticus TaxID=2895559 RepID=UPI001E3A3DC3|nr:hypothetical protein [Subtercola endophyticus]UFS58850.1 hypothetical protein LQ955_17925 [Subtercola endophyticus]